ncbi:MAG TPA: hypothetical protein VG099_03595, partial [Gemmataceae bacterium]|nr:hypothetical protein [Gemmataceae bacterium]
PTNAKAAMNGVGDEWIYTEMKDRPLTSLLLELAQLVSGEKRRELKKLNDAWAALPSGGDLKEANVERIINEITSAIQSLR